MANHNVPDSSHGGKFQSGRPSVIVIHSLEAPPKPGISVQLAEGWLQNTTASVHAIADPSDTVDSVPLDTIAYHCGGGNPYSIGDEHTGYAAWTFEQWTNEPAFSALRLGAQKVASQAKSLGWSADNLRWLSIAQIRAGEKGLATHNDMRLAFGGTTHTDPGPNFPYAIFIKMVQQFFGAPVNPTPNPNPSSPGEGGSESDDKMYVFFKGNDGKICVGDGLTWWHVPTPADLQTELWRVQDLLKMPAQYCYDGGTGLKPLPTEGSWESRRDFIMQIPGGNDGTWGRQVAAPTK